ncbi:MAG: hypothetical protein MI923_23135 [Phycisphaerales bacterium]|nr:hypothetical protein [Phycisphaerales bacterium]
MAGQHRFDLVKLDTESTQLYLPVGAAQHFDIAVRPVEAEVSSAVQGPAGLFRQAALHETLGRKVGAVDVTAGKTVAGQANFADDPDRHRIARGVQNIGPRVRYRPPERYGGSDRIGVTDREHRRIGCVLGRAVGRNKATSVFGVSSQRFLLVDEIPECRKRKYVIQVHGTYIL